jgi:hypothetical protein
VQVICDPQPAPSFSSGSNQRLGAKCGWLLLLNRNCRG